MKTKLKYGQFNLMIIIFKLIKGNSRMEVHFNVLKLITVTQQINILKRISNDKLKRCIKNIWDFSVSVVDQNFQQTKYDQENP